MHHLAENQKLVKILVSKYPNYLQYTDACKLVAGGLIETVIQSIQPWVWKYAWTQEVQNKLVSHINPRGRLTINDIELAGIFLGWLVLEYVAEDLKFKHIGSFCDST